MKETKRSFHYLLAFIGIVTAIVLDQFTKHLAVIHLKDQMPFVIWENVFQLEYLENRGAAFGMLQNQRIFFYFSVVLITGAFFWFYKNVPTEKRFLPLRLCSVLIMAGAYGNFIDRIRMNYVVDFFYFKLIDFPVFNVADIYVTVATILLVLFLFFYYKEEDLERIIPSRK